MDSNRNLSVLLLKEFQPSLWLQKIYQPYMRKKCAIGTYGSPHTAQMKRGSGAWSVTMETGTSFPRP
ncbi:hypothetical protein DPMN_090651 [Dreissena polymorpha]|uniref:Uncharacterized protein n=1 Tax=Dreissena polymorpha TaxID=45954 RepID=A0A9D4L051_DREPO|nr:hypothetical protein DPMN_090651 [Dreissena polymorpha]